MNKLESFIIGSLLGDGSIPKPKKETHNGAIRFGHCEKQLPYLEWKLLILEEFSLRTGNIQKCISKSSRYKNGECISYHGRSKSSEIFTRYRKLFYPEGKKIIPVNVEITPMALAIWFMDDGQKCTRSYQINTQGFEREELEKVVLYLKQTYNLEFLIEKDRVIYLRTISIAKFEFLIREFIPECMKYKLRSPV